MPGDVRCRAGLGVWVWSVPGFARDRKLIMRLLLSNLDAVLQVVMRAAAGRNDIKVKAAAGASTGDLKSALSVEGFKENGILSHALE